jgi:hypothetical protein
MSLASADGITLLLKQAALFNQYLAVLESIGMRMSEASRGAFHDEHGLKLSVE